MIRGQSTYPVTHKEHVIEARKVASRCWEISTSRPVKHWNKLMR